ncbi:MAG: 1-acyl-sn-glycerol-3-phosphate acyltransferase [Acidobacteria bacterium]|nr:1-acyl-sn-glycerol-3-phosphate acyltransferase [Acidobacteriota bacterium]MCA1609933.1 1-acyl-sn-glycerol-3-phosphate acyltransferase [Acidobacteriota bacterium]
MRPDLGKRLAFYFGCLFGGAWFVFCSAAGTVWLLVSPGNRQTLYWFGRVFCRGLTRLMGWRVHPDHPDRLRAMRPCVIVGNHQSFLDVVTFGSIFPPRTVSAGKREIGNIPVFGWFYRLSGNLIIDRAHARSALASLETAADSMRTEKIAVWFMPEGHRNQTERLLPFKSGAFRLAIAAQAPVIPVVAEPLTAIADTRRRLARAGTLRVRVLEPVPTEGLSPSDVSALTSRVRDRMQEALDAMAASAL